MKRILLIIFIFSTLASFAQLTTGFNYQAIARNNTGAVIPNQHVNLRFTVYSGSPHGSTIYLETDTTTTNQFGLFSVVIGTGTATVGTFSQVSWTSASTYLMVEIDPTGGNNFITIGTSQLQSVPYANALSNPIGFTAQDASFQDIAAGATASIGFDSVVFNDGNGYNSNAFTAPVAGVYQFDVSVVIATVYSTNGYVILQILKNGSVAAQKVYVGQENLDYSGLLKLAQGDVISVSVTNDNSTSEQFGDSYPLDTYFSGFKVY